MLYICKHLALGPINENELDVFIHFRYFLHKGPVGEPQGGKTKAFDCNFFYIYKTDFFLLFSLYVRNVVLAEFTASNYLAVNFGLNLL